MALPAVGLFLTREKFLSFFERFNKNNVFPACEHYNTLEDDFLQAFAEGARRGRLDRPAQADLQDADAKLAGATFVEAEFVERFADVGIGFAGGDDADARAGAAFESLAALMPFPPRVRRRFPAA